MKSHINEAPTEFGKNRTARALAKVKQHFSLTTCTQASPSCRDPTDRRFPSLGGSDKKKLGRKPTQQLFSGQRCGFAVR